MQFSCGVPETISRWYMAMCLRKALLRRFAPTESADIQYGEVRSTMIAEVTGSDLSDLLPLLRGYCDF
jgi:hypothetical protein